ncbi:MAG: MFS transporter [Pyrinomonadaceae bacterium]
MRSPSLHENKPLRYVVFFYLYVMQGIPAGFALTAVTNYLTAEGLRPYEVGRFVALVGLPWALQFIWGPIIDRFQGSVMGRRKPWVILAQLMSFVASLGVLMIVDPVAQVFNLSLAFFIHSVFASVQDASVDAMAISTIPVTERGRVNAFMRGGLLFGIGLGAAVLSYLLRNWGFFYAALTQSLLLFGMMVITFFIKEKSEDALFPWASRDSIRRTTIFHNKMSLRFIFAELYQGVFAPKNLLLFGAIVLVYVCSSIFIRALSIHLIQQLHWQDTALSVLTGTYGMIVAMLSVLVAGVLSDKIGTRRLLMVVMVMIGGYLISFNLLSSFWSNPAFAKGGLVVWYTFDPMYSVAAMPVLMSLCRQGVEDLNSPPTWRWLICPTLWVRTLPVTRSRGSRLL